MRLAITKVIIELTELSRSYVLLRTNRGEATGRSYSATRPDMDGLERYFWGLDLVTELSGWSRKNIEASMWRNKRETIEFCRGILRLGSLKQSSQVLNRTQAP